MPSRLLEVVCFTGNSGLTDYSISLCRALSQHWTVRLVVGESVATDSDRVGFDIVRTFRRTRNYPVDILTFALRLVRDAPHILLVQSWLKAPIVEAMAFRFLKRRGYKVFVTVHDTLPHYPSPWSRLELAFYYRSFDGLLAHSERSKLDLIGMGVNRPVFVAPHGVYDIFSTRKLSRAEARLELGLPEKGQIALYFGHIDARKGCFAFLNAAHKLAASRRDIHFVMAGQNDLSAIDRDRLNLHRGATNVTLRDSRIPFEQVQLFFRAADVVVLPYREGTTSGVFKLAVAFGVPVLAAEVGDLIEAIDRGSALSIGTGEAIEGRMTAELERICEDPGYIRRFREALSVEAEASSWTNVAATYLEMLEG